MPVLTLGKNFLSLCILMQKKKGMLVPFQEASINALQLAGITFLLETSSSLVAYVIHLNTADFTCDNYIISIYTYNASITPALDEQIRLPFVSFLLCSEPMLKVLSFFFFILRKLQFILSCLSKPGWWCDLSALTIRGDKVEKLIKSPTGTSMQMYLS